MPIWQTDKVAFLEIMYIPDKYKSLFLVLSVYIFVEKINSCFSLYEKLFTFFCLPVKLILGKLQKKLFF